MPKKDAATAVLGMLSTVGAQTRVAEPVEAQVPVAVPEPVPVQPSADTRPSASVSTLPAPPAPAAQATAAPDKAPRTLRLRADTAEHLRAAWLEAKRDDVLLTAQDFASNLVDDALARRRRARAAASR
jgi:hypothetical protein